jgi:hypothetical protein
MDFGLLLKVFGVDFYDFSTGDWVVIAIALIGLPFVVTGTILMYLVWHRPSAHLRFDREWWINRGIHLEVPMISVWVQVAPYVASAMVEKITASIRDGKRVLPLASLPGQEGLALEGAKRLELMFRLDRSITLTDKALLKICVRLYDKTTARFEAPISSARILE